MLFFGDRYDAAALLRMGVAWRVVPDDQLLTEANAVAGRLAALPPLAVRAMKRVLNQTASTDLRIALASRPRPPSRASWIRRRPGCCRPSDGKSANARRAYDRPT